MVETRILKLKRPSRNASLSIVLIGLSDNILCRFKKSKLPGERGIVWTPWIEFVEVIVSLLTYSLLLANHSMHPHWCGFRAVFVLECVSILVSDHKNGKEEKHILG